MKKYLLLFSLLLPTVAFGQGARVDNPGGPAQRVVQGFVAPIPGATITVCTSAGTGTPCTPVVPTSPVTLCTDSGCTVAAANPFLADANGNFGFWALPGSYKVSITATGVTGQLLSVTLPCVAGTSCVASNANTAFTGNNTTSGTWTNSGVWTWNTNPIVPNAGIASAGPDLLVAKKLSTIRFADQFAGADWCAKVNAADADLGATPGEIWLNQNAGQSACAASPTLSSNHTLKFIQQGTWTIGTVPLLLNPFSGAQCDAGFFQTVSGQCILLYTNTSAYAVSSANQASINRGAFLRGGMVIEVNQNGAGGIDLTNMAEPLFEDVVVASLAGTSTAKGLNLFANQAGAYYGHINRVAVKFFSTCLNVDASTLGNAPNRWDWDNLFCGASLSKDINITANGGDQHFTHLRASNLAASGTFISSASPSSTFSDVYADTPGATATGLSLASGAVGNMLFGVNIASGFATPCTIASGANSNHIFGITASCTDAGTNNFILQNNNGAMQPCARQGAVTAAQFSLSAGWGTTATASTVLGNDCSGVLIITASGTGQAANPTFVFTFKNGSFQGNGTSLIFARSDGNAPANVLAGCNTSLSTPTCTFFGTPVAANTYQFNWIVGDADEARIALRGPAGAWSRCSIGPADGAA